MALFKAILVEHFSPGSLYFSAFLGHLDEHFSGRALFLALLLVLFLALFLEANFLKHFFSALFLVNFHFKALF